MNIAVAVDDEVRHEARLSAREVGPATKRIVVGYGFWIFLLSDIVMFSALFAAYAVLAHATAGGLGGRAAVQPTQCCVKLAALSLRATLRINVSGGWFAALCRDLPGGPNNVCVLGPPSLCWNSGSSLE